MTSLAQDKLLAQVQKNTEAIFKSASVTLPLLPRWLSGRTRDPITYIFQ